MKKRFLTISEFSEATGLTRKALRIYDSRGLLIPEERTESGYRLYSELQKEKAKKIKQMRGEGLSLSQISEFFSSGEGRMVPGTLRFHRISDFVLGASQKDLIENIKQTPNLIFLNLFANITVAAKAKVLEVISPKGIDRMKKDLLELESESEFWIQNKSS